MHKPGGNGFSFISVSWETLEILNVTCRNTSLHLITRENVNDVEKNLINIIWYQNVLNMVISQRSVYGGFYAFPYLFSMTMNYLVAREKIFFKSANIWALEQVGE